MADRRLSRVRLTLRLFWRSLCGGELTLLLTVLVLAAGLSAGVSRFNNRMDRTLDNLAAEFLAADLLVQGHHPLPEAWAVQARKAGLSTAEYREFTSVVAAHERFQLAAVKAVDAGYPLRGAVETADLPGAPPHRRTGGPAPGRVWVDERLLLALGARVGDAIAIGEAQLRIEAVLTHEPDRRSGLSAVAPRVMMAMEDLARTRVIQPGSRLHYTLLFAGAEGAVRAMQQRLRPQLGADRHLLSRGEDAPELGGLPTALGRFFTLAHSVVLAMAGLAAVLAAQRHAERHFDTVALLRCLGAGRNLSFYLLAGQLLLATGVAWIVGNLVGIGIDAALAQSLRAVLPQQLAEPDLRALPVSAGALLSMVAGFALPPLAALRQVTPLRVYRRDLPGLRVSDRAQAAAGIGAMFLLLWWSARDAALALRVLVVGGAACALAIGGIAGVVRMTARSVPYRWPVGWRLGLRRAAQMPWRSAEQVVAVGVSLTAAILLYPLQGAMVDGWRESLPPDAPNFFAINIVPEEIGAFRLAVEELGFRPERVYDVVPGRLVAINDRSLHGGPVGGSGQRYLRRELALTSSEVLPAGNRLVAGSWFVPGAGVQVSVEQEFARALGIGIGDRLRFQIDDQAVEATVAGLRHVRWTSLQPNFFVVFTPGALDRFATTGLTSFGVPAALRGRTIDLVRRFPAVTLYDVEALAERTRGLMRQGARALELVVLLALAASGMVVVASIQAAGDVRRREFAVLRALGAGKAVLAASLRAELGLLGLLAGVLAAGLAELLGLVVYQRFFDLPWHPHAGVWLTTPLAGVLLWSIGSFSVRAQLRTSVARTLGEAE